MSRYFVRLFWIAGGVCFPPIRPDTSPKFELSLLSVGSASEASGASMFACVFLLDVFGLVDAIPPPTNNKFSLRLVSFISCLGSSSDASGAPENSPCRSSLYSSSGENEKGGR